jgi:hypothetical protein
MNLKDAMRPATVVFSLLPTDFGLPDFHPLRALRSLRLPQSRLFPVIPPQQYSIHHYPKRTYAQKPLEKKLQKAAKSCKNGRFQVIFGPF